MKKSILSKICLTAILIFGSIVSYNGVTIANNNEDSISMTENAKNYIQSIKGEADSGGNVRYSFISKVELDKETANLKIFNAVNGKTREITLKTDDGKSFLGSSDSFDSGDWKPFELEFKDRGDIKRLNRRDLLFYKANVLIGSTKKVEDDIPELKDGQKIVIKASNQHPNKGEVVKYTIKSADKDVSEIYYSGNVWFNDRSGNIENSLSQEFQTLDDNGNLVMYVNLTTEHIKDGVYYFNELHLKRNTLPDYIQLNRQDLIETDSTSKVYVGVNNEEPIGRPQLQGKKFGVYANYKKIRRGTPVKYTIKTEEDKIRDSGFLLSNSSNDSFYSQFATYDSAGNRIVFVDTNNLEIGKKYNVGTLGDSIGSDIKPEDIYNADGEFEVSNEDVRRDKPENIDTNEDKTKSNQSATKENNVLNKLLANTGLLTGGMGVLTVIILLVIVLILRKKK